MSHFSTIKTELRDRDALVAALTALGHAPATGPCQVRGYRGQLETADLVVSGNNGGDLGFRWNPANGAYELVTDLDLWSLTVPPERSVVDRLDPVDPQVVNRVREAMLDRLAQSSPDAARRLAVKCGLPH